MTQASELRQQLRALKLSGIIETLEIRLNQAQNNHLSYSEWLGLLLSDEQEKRSERKLRRLIQQAGIRKMQTLENFDFTFNPHINAAYIKELATGKFITKGENIFLLGPTGVGKTHLTQAICHNACRLNYKVAYFKFYDLFNKLKLSEYSETFKRLLKVDLLSIDDFAFKKIDQIEAEHLYTLIDSRYRMKSIIITSNRAFNDWMSVFPDPVIGNAILDRLAHNAHQIIIKGESYRKRFTPKFEQ